MRKNSEGLHPAPLFRNRKSGAGFTLIEILIAVAIMTVLGSLALFVSFDQYRNYSINAERDLLVSMLQKARNQSMNNINEARHGVKILATSYVIFRGNSYLVRAQAFDEVIPKSIAITTSGNDEFLFNQLRGDVVVAGDIDLSNGVRTHTISVNSEGRINW